MSFYDCPHAEICKTCPCADEDDVCFPGERLREELRIARFDASVAEGERDMVVAAETMDLRAERDAARALLREVDEYFAVMHSGPPVPGFLWARIRALLDGEA